MAGNIVSNNRQNLSIAVWQRFVCWQRFNCVEKTLKFQKHCEGKKIPVKSRGDFDVASILFL